MHRCLEVIDILTEIVEIVGASKPDNQPDVSRALTDLARLARTCKTFHLASVKCLWRRIADFDALFYKCLPDYLWEREEVITSDGEKAISIDLTRYPTKEEWARADYYASLVTEFFPWWDDDLGVPTQQLNVLLTRGPKFLVFPNTHIVNWKTNEANALKYLPKLFLAPGIVWITIEISTLPCWKMWTAIVQHIAVSCPLLERLHLSCHITLLKDGSSDKEPSSLPGIDKFKYLRHLDVGELPLTDQALVRLSGLPNLQHLSCTIASATPGASGHLPDPASCFPSLLGATIRIEQVTAPILARLNMIQPRDWVEVIIGMLLPDTEKYSDLLSVFCSGKHANTLESLQTDVYSFARFPTSGDLAPPIAGRALFPTRGAPNLVALKLVGASFMITDDELQELSRGWPRLKFLALDPRHRERQYSPLTLAGLCWLAHCPALEKAHVEFDARAFDSGVMQALIASLPTTCPLKSLIPGRSPITNPLSVAALLCGLFRGLESVSGHQEPRELPVPRDYTQWMADTQGWKVVKAMVASRKKTREAGAQ